MKASTENAKLNSRINASLLKSEEMSKMASLAFDEASQLYKSGSALATKTFRFLRTNWKPTLILASVGIGSYLIYRGFQSSAPIVTRAKSRTH